MRFQGDVIIVSGEPEWIRDLTSSIAIESGLSVPAHMAKPVNLHLLHELLAQSARQLAQASSLRASLGSALGAGPPGSMNH
jgi:hypothetical protein